MKLFYRIFFLSALLIAGCESSILDDPATTIGFSIPQESHVKVTIENSYNTVMAVLMDEPQQSGTYQVHFQQDNLAEGVYYYIIEITGLKDNSYQKIVKPMVLIK